MKLNNFLAVFILAAIFICPSFAGDTNFNSIFGTRTFSLNGLYFAGVDGLSNVLSNPAGLSFLNKKGIELSVSDQISSHQFESSVEGNYKSYSPNSLDTLYQTRRDSIITDLDGNRWSRRGDY
ncbi:MAG: hypothetical protein ABI550_09080, partial [Ignavibacteriaceae bacterium]